MVSQLDQKSLWTLLPQAHPEWLAQLHSTFGIAEPFNQLLASRCVEDINQVRRFLDPRLDSLSDPFDLPGMDAAVTRIYRAIDAGEKILIYGDYDVDGVTSTAIVFKILSAFTQHVECFIPERIEDGYGLNIKSVEKCLTKAMPGLMIAVDCGTTAHTEIEHIQSVGIDVIVLDHHELKETPPACAAFVNPKQNGQHDYLCSAGVTFKLAHALLKRRRTTAFDLKHTLDLVALGTVADLVPLHGENRVLVKKGLEQMGRTMWPGLRELLDVAGVEPTPTSTDISFKLAPRLNAAGRLGKASDALEILIAENSKDMRQRISSLDEQNNRRKEIAEDVYEKAEAQLQASGDLALKEAIVVGDNGWHQGVIGIVAAKLMQKYNKPIIVISFDANGLGKGSCRGIQGVSLVTALNEAGSYLIQHGGHDLAAGLAIKQTELEGFRNAFEESIRSQREGEQQSARVVLDAEINLGDVTLAFLEAQDALAPFGMGNPIPLYLIRNVTPDGAPRVLKQKHLQLKLKQGRHTAKAIWFNHTDQGLPPPPWDVAVEVSANYFQGTVSPQLQIKDLRAAE